MKSTLPASRFTILFTIALIATLVSCRPTDYVGHYELRHFPKTSIKLTNDGTFVFTKINPNPYLHPFDHPEDNYFVTSGTWTVTKNTLTLNSNKAPTTTKDPEVIESKVLTKVDSFKNGHGQQHPSSYTTFTFYDIFGDTVNILYAQFPDSSSIAQLHSSMKYLKLPTADRERDYDFHMSDTIEFHFYGYKPYQFIRPDREGRAIKIQLYPEERSAVFENRHFIINRKRIKDHKIRFDKKKR